MEINSHSGIGYLQSFYPLLLDEKVKDYFEWKLRKIDGLSERERSIRNAVRR